MPRPKRINASDSPSETPTRTRRDFDEDRPLSPNVQAEDEMADELDLSEEERELMSGGGDQALLNELNDPGTTPLGPPPSLGRGVQHAGDLFGRGAVAHGRASTPKLWSQAAQFPSCVQLRVWRWENGIPAGLGVIDAEATEEDFVHQFYEAMPVKGQGKFQFKIRPIDIRGQEMGTESTINISEHHGTLQSIRRARQAEIDESARMHQTPPPPTNSENDSLNASMASEMSRMFERAVDAADSRNHALENALQEERDRLRMDDERRAQERIDMATSAAAGVQSITERMMGDEARRADRALQAEAQRSQLLLTTLTGIFANAQQQQTQMGAETRASDARRLDQERQYAERVREEQEARRLRDIQEMEQRRKAEQNRLEDERQQLRIARDTEIRQAELRMKAESEELQRRLEREKGENAVKIAMEEKRMERERLENETRLQSRKEDEDRRLNLEKQELDRRTQRERLEWEHRWKLEADERERRDRIDREERERRAELEAQRRKAESEERGRKDALEREDRDRRASIEKEASENRRLEVERRGRIEEDSSKARDQERQRQHELQLKQLDSVASRDREHAERMTTMQMAAMQSQREQADARLRQEREENQLREQERQRQHERLLKESELKAQQDREHAERMMQLSQQQLQQKTLGGLGELLPKARELLASVGIEPGDIIQRLLMPEAPAGAAGSSWADAIPKVLSSLAEIGKVAVDATRVPPPAQPPAQLRVPNMQQVNIPGLPAGYMAVQLPAGAGFQPVNGIPGAPVPAAQPAATPASQTPAPAASSTSTRALPEPTGIDTELDFGRDAPGEMLFEDDDGATGSVEEPPVQEEAPPDTTAIAKQAGLAPTTIKTARKALRTLIRRLQGTKPDMWFGTIAAALQAEMSIYHYVKAVTVREALAEGGASDDLSNRIIDSMKESGLIPSDVNYE